MFSKSLVLKYGVFIPVLLALLILSIGINKPFVGHHDFTNAFDGVIARNYLEVGVLELKFGQSSTLLTTNYTGRISYFTHYLPGLPFLIYLSFLLFGVYEWSERLVPITFSLIGVVSLFLICKGVWDIKVAFLASFFYIFNPMFIYFGKMAVPEPLVLGMSLLSIYYFLNWFESNYEKDFRKLILSLFIGGLVGWPICYLGILFVVYGLLLRRFNKRLFIPGLVLFFTILLQLLHAFILTGSFLGGGIMIAIFTRSLGGNLSFGGTDFSLISYLKQEISILQAYYTRILLIFSVLGSIIIIRKAIGKEFALLILLFLFGFGHLVLFSRYVFIHDFLNIYLLPFLSITGSIGVLTLINKLESFKFNSILSTIILFLVIALFGLERLSFTKALLLTDMNRPGLEMAKVLNKYQKEGREAVIISPRFESFFGVFANFYSKFPYDVSSEEILKDDDNLRKYKYLVFIDEDISDKLFFEKFKIGKNHEKINDVTIIFNK